MLNTAVVARSDKAESRKTASRSNIESVCAATALMKATAVSCSSTSTSISIASRTSVVARTSAPALSKLADMSRTSTNACTAFFKFPVVRVGANATMACAT